MLYHLFWYSLNKLIEPKSRMQKVKMNVNVFSLAAIFEGGLLQTDASNNSNLILDLVS